MHEVCMCVYALYRSECLWVSVWRIRGTSDISPNLIPCLRKGILFERVNPRLADLQSSKILQSLPPILF